MAAVGAWYTAASAAQVASAVATAVAVAASVQQTVQANATANAQEDAAKLRNEQLVEQTVANYGELADVELDAQQRAFDDTFEVQKNYTQAKGRTNVMAAAMGTGGMSVKTQLQELEKDKYSNYNTILQSRQASLDNIKSQAEAARFQAASGMNVTPISRPSYAAAALNIGSTALSGYSSYQDISKESQLLNKASVSSGG